MSYGSNLYKDFRITHDSKLTQQEHDKRVKIMTLKRHLLVACSVKTIIMIFKSIGGNAVTPISKGYKNSRDDGDAWLVLNVGAFHCILSQRIHPALVTTTEPDSVSAERNLALAVHHHHRDTDLNACHSRSLTFANLVIFALCTPV